MNLFSRINNYFKNDFSKQFKVFVIEIYFNVIFFCTQSQIIYHYFIKNERIQRIFCKVKSFLPKEPKYACEFIKNGNIVSSLTSEQINNKEYKIPENDFYIFSDYENSKTDCIQKVIHRKSEIENLSSIPSFVKFILVEITIGIDTGIEKSIKISFTTDKYNYLMTNNIIDNKFMKYFLKKHYYKEITDIHLIKNYKMKIIDNDVKIHFFDNFSKILLLENDYIIENEKIFEVIVNNK
jgi:hypothetical protein